MEQGDTLFVYGNYLFYDGSKKTFVFLGATLSLAATTVLSCVCANTPTDKAHDKREELLNDWITKKQKSTYVRISDGWRNCDFKYPGWIKE